jgi:hypothetical protein
MKTPSKPRPCGGAPPIINLPEVMTPEMRRRFVAALARVIARQILADLNQPTDEKPTQKSP